MSTDQERVPNGGNPIWGKRKDNAIPPTTNLHARDLNENGRLNCKY
jgi:hypothetical protein